MKITKEKTNYLLVTARDSRFSGTDYAILAIDDLTSASQAEEASMNDNKDTLDVKSWYCIYLEVEKMSKELFNFIAESRQIEEWRFRFIDKELYDELLEHCEIDTNDYSVLQQSEEGINFELYDEAGSEGYYMRFSTDSSLSTRCINNIKVSPLGVIRTL